MSRYEDERRGTRRGKRNQGEKSELSAAAERLEAAIEDLVASASGAVSDKAAGVVDDLERSARRLKEQMDDPAYAEDEDGTSAEPERGRRRRRRHRRRQRRNEWMLDPDEWFRANADALSTGSSDANRANGWLRDLYREPERGWIAGVCAGMARYYEVDVWVARVVAFSLLIFIPQIAFWAYIIAVFMLARRPRVDAPTPVKPQVQEKPSPAPELGPRLAPRTGMRNLRVRFRDLELRLRRMEELVTSNEFTLRRELSALEAEEGRTA